MKKIIATSVLMCWVTAAYALVHEYEVGQKNKTFTTEKLVVKVGDTVKFTNQDSFFHNVFSLSSVKSFDLGSYPKGKHRFVTFDKPGTVEIECAIHPSMRMKIEVKE